MQQRLIDANELERKAKFNQQVGNFIKLSDLKNAPTIDVEPVVHGHWIKSDNSKWKKCSICSRANQYYYKYCPWCGAKMDKEAEQD